MLEKHYRIIMIGLLFCLLFWIASCAVNPVSGGRELMLLSESQEIELGRKTDGQVVRQYGLYEDEKFTEYLNGFCRRLGKLSHRPNLNYQFKIVDTATVNAFAVPGGYIYFTRGILAHLNNEAEVVGVIGHEMGHITARHSAQQYTRAQFAQVGLGLGMILSETVRSFGDLAQFGVGMLFLRFSRDNERQADDLGVEYASKAGYDASQMANFFDTLERMHAKSDRSGLPDWFSTHPNPIDRQATVRKRATGWQRKLGVNNLKIDRDQYLRRIDGLVYGEDPRQGYVEQGVFYHPVLKLQFPVPSKWKLENTRSFVRMVSERKDAAILFSLSSARSPKEAAQSFVSKNKATVIESGRGNVKGLSAYRMISQVRSSKGAVQIMSYFIQKDNKVYVFHGFSALSSFDRYRDTFEGTMTQFRNLSDSKKLNVKPSRIRIRSTRAAGSMRQALRSLGVPADKLKELAVLNGKHLDENVPANTLLKIVAK
ncbi:MAG: M48 family metalloprotease [Desulfobacteraceae bacterium]|nr:MAG: M48 family metalloprotease [Desulfobacteraceae bacterium]